MPQVFLPSLIQILNERHFKNWRRAPQGIVLLSWWHGKWLARNGVLSGVFEDNLASIFERVKSPQRQTSELTTCTANIHLAC